MGNNGHTRSDLRVDFIKSRIVKPNGELFSDHRLPRNGRNGNGCAYGHRMEMNDAVPESVDFRVLPDGTLIDLVSDASELQPRLLIWKTARATICADFRYGDRRFVPPRLDPSLMRAVRLPTAITANLKVGDLVQNLQACISTYIDMEPQFVRLVSNFILATWFSDRSTVAPYLFVTGPYGGGKTTLLRLLHCLCRRAVLSSDLSPASLYLLSSVIMPTLLIDEFDSGTQSRHREALRLLRSGSTQGGQIFRAGKPYGTFCTKVIASREGPPDAALTSRAISVSILPTRRLVPELDTAAQDRIANQFQGQLLAYRLQNYFKIPTSVQPDFTPRLRDLARALAAPLLGEQRLEQQLIADLQPQDEEAKMDRGGEPEWAVATALYQECHTTSDVLTVGSLASSVNDLLARVGESYSLKPRAVGSYLRSLGLKTCKLGNLGRGLRLTQVTKEQAHKLVSDMGIRRADIVNYEAVDAGYAGPPCSLCEKHALLVQEDGTKLRTVDIFAKLRHKPRPTRTAYE